MNAHRTDSNLIPERDQQPKPSRFQILKLEARIAPHGGHVHEIGNCHWNSHAGKDVGCGPPH